MVNSDAIFQLIENVAATASKNEKQALVARYAQGEQFKRVLEYAYNPFKTYGIAKRPPVICDHGIQEFDDDTWVLLDDLISRKATGNVAIEYVRGEMSALSKESAELFWRIIKKDLRAGFSESTINKAAKGLIPSFPYMRCILAKDANFDEFDWVLGVPSQEKADGMFANLDVEPGCANFTSRQGSPFPMEPFAEIVDEALSCLQMHTQSHGELLVRKAGVICERATGNGILNGILSGGQFEADEEPVYLIWDQIPLSAVVKKGKYEVPYVKRLHGIAQQLKAPAYVSLPGSIPSIALIDTRICHSLKAAYEHAGELMKKGKEGTIIKNPYGVWRDTGSSGSKDLVKIKLEFNMDLKIIAVVPGKADGKNEGRAGSLTCETSDGLLRVDVTVKNDAIRSQIDADPSDWVGRVIDVIANDITKPSDSNPLHSLFLPRMAEAGYRLDKTEADDLERVFAQKEAAIFGASLVKELKAA